MKNLLTITLLLFFSITHAQIVFEKGYFINNAGKKTECYIENLDWRNNPVTFTYKLNENDAQKNTENIANVSEFGIDNVSMYKRFTVNIERSKSGTAQLQKTKNPVWKSETIFLHALVTGQANLYSYIDDNITRYFFETKQSPVEQLVYIRYTNDLAENSGIQENNLYRQQLRNAVSCGDMTENTFKKIEYNKTSLIKHFVAYNSCSGDVKSMNYNAADEAQRETFALRIVAGVFSGKVSVSDPDRYYDMNSDASQMGFRFGLDAEYILPFNKGTWSIFVNPTYQKFSPSENFSSPVTNPGFSNNGDIVNYTLKADYATIEIPIGVRHYFFLSNSSRIFANIGYVIVLDSSDGNIDFTNSNNLVSAQQTIPISSRNNAAIGLGFAYKRFSAEVRYNTTRQISKLPLWDANYSTIGLNLGFKIL